MKNVVLDEVKNEKNKKVREILENICNYFNQDKEIIVKFIKGNKV